MAAPGSTRTRQPKPGQPRSLARLAAERAWQALGLEAGVAVDIFRLPGIYGPGRSAIDQVKAGTARRIDKPGQVFSRIHVEDIAGTVLMAITAGARRRHLQRGRRPAGFDQRRGRLRLRAAGQAGAARHPVGAGRADDERHGALVLCRDTAREERQDQERARRRAALSDLSRGPARHRGGWRPPAKAPAPRPSRSGARCRPAC